MTQQVMSEELVQELRKSTFPLAYRLVGSAAEAEDLVQEALLRYQTAVGKGTAVLNPHGFLVTTTTRLAIDHLRSARVTREVYPGEWLPEPIVQQDGGSPSEQAEMAESLSLAFMVLLETLSPLERAVFLLRNVFDYEYAEIADILGRTEVSCRQAFSRAKKHVADKRPRFETSAEKRRALAKQFFATCRDGSLADLEEMLAADVEFHGDGGGVASAVQRAVVGCGPVARLMRGIFDRAEKFEVDLSEVSVNGQPGLLFKDCQGAVVSVLSVQVADDKVRALHSIINPDKLHHLGKVSDLARISKSR